MDPYIPVLCFSDNNYSSVQYWCFKRIGMERSLRQALISFIVISVRVPDLKLHKLRKLRTRWLQLSSCGGEGTRFVVHAYSVYIGIVLPITKIPATHSISTAVFGGGVGEGEISHPIGVRGRRPISARSSLKYCHYYYIVSRPTHVDHNNNNYIIISR